MFETLKLCKLWVENSQPMKRLLLFLLPALLISCNQRFNPVEKLGKYDVVWDTPSKDYTGSMPLGNGDISLNAWMETNGDLLFYIGKTDTWGDNSRLLKLGKVRVQITPAQDLSVKDFSQRLNLAAGMIEISIGPALDPVKISVRVDANHPFIEVAADSPEDIQLKATIELWRNEPYELPSFEVSDVLLDRSKPDQKHEACIVEPDIMLADQESQIGWYHHNKKSVGPELTMDVQGLSGYPLEDPILNRTFGAIIRGRDADRLDENNIQTKMGKSHKLEVYVLTEHPSSPQQWLNSINKIAGEIESLPYGLLYDKHVEWWNDFWSRSWIFAGSNDNQEDEEDAAAVNRGYLLQRFINGCAGRGNYPIKFNGSIFTVPFPGAPGDADYRRWGPGYWWQNTRLPYLGMCTSGDFEMLKPMFNMYAGQVFDISKYRTKEYFGFEGVYFPECINFWGTVFSESYGWTPAVEREDKLQVSGYHKWEWVCGPELVWMMMDYYEHTMDEVFLKDTILPVAMEVMKFFDNFYSTNENGKLVMHPSQAVETWWDCTNPMPELSGLIAITGRILNLPDKFVNGNIKEWITGFQAKLPDLPLRYINEDLALAPADKYANKSNIENPELYAVFPFRLVSLEKHNVDWGIKAFEHRWDRGNFGWRQEEIFMAYLGLAGEARSNLVDRAKKYDTNSRFPAFWGPNYDWVPDQDHGGILIKAFQAMIMQTEGEKIFLTPAWPEGWDAEFKFHAPQKTIISGSVKEGIVKNLKVIPASRKKDVIIMNQ